MSDLIRNLPYVLAHTPLVALVLVLFGGVITSIGPCNLAMVPIIMAYVAGQEDVGRREGFWLSLFFTLGSAVTFVILGIIVALVGGLFGSVKSVLYYLVAVVCLLLAFSMLHLWQINLPVWNGLLEKVQGKRGLGGAFITGLVMGLAGSQCGTPVLLAILSVVMLKGSLTYGALLLFVYALGRGLPIILAGTFAGILKNMEMFVRWSYALETAAGVVLLVVAAYFAWIA